MSHARAALAGALVMLLGIWIMTNDQSGWTTQDIVFAVLSLLIVVLLLLGVNIRRSRWGFDGDDKPKDKPDGEGS